MTHSLSRFVRPAAAIALTLGASVAFAHPGTRATPPAVACWPASCIR